MQYSNTCFHYYDIEYQYRNNEYIIYIFLFIYSLLYNNALFSAALRCSTTLINNSLEGKKDLHYIATICCHEKGLQ
jgi:hypothetical protein